MSAKVLRELDPTHTLQDDMESLIYVVLYSALLHLPHNLQPKELTQFIETFFEQIEEWDGELFGGTAKDVNIGNRHMTMRVKFQAHLQKWLETVLDMHSSMEKAQKDGSVDMWTDPSHLESFWAKFLVENDLGQNDRLDNLLESPDIPTTVVTVTPHVSIGSPSTPDKPTGPSKRKNGEEPAVSKRRRTHATLDAPLVLRRSTRERKSRVEEAPIKLARTPSRGRPPKRRASFRR